ncbi:MAG: hypothetical protein ACREHE_07810 [Rhizomicrobium sp.]
MRAPTATEALGVWERGQGQSQTERGLALLGLADTQASWDTLADMPIGARDAMLLSLREAMFGQRLESCADCPQCGALMELDFTTRMLRAPPATGDTVAFNAGGMALTVRLVTSRDLLALDTSDPPQARMELLSRCLFAAADGRATPVPAILTETIAEAAAQALSLADPQADVTINLTCANCGHAWAAPFDILSYLWTELDGWARRMLADIHTLARAYGWREADVLALGPLRRKFYLEMAAS